MIRFAGLMSAMDDADGVCVIECCGHLGDDVGHRLRAQGTGVGKVGGQGGAVDQFLDDERPIGILAGVEHGDDPRMAQLRSRVSLSLETLGCLGITGEVRAEGV